MVPRQKLYAFPYGRENLKIQRATVHGARQKVMTLIVFQKNHVAPGRVYNAAAGRAWEDFQNVDKEIYMRYGLREY